MSLKLEVFKPITIEDLKTSGQFDDREIKIYEYLIRAYENQYISEKTNISRSTLDKIVLAIRKKLGYSGKLNIGKSQNIININSALGLSGVIFEQNNPEVVSRIKNNFIIDFTDSQKLVAKLTLNGYSKTEIANIFKMQQINVYKHLQNVWETFDCELNLKDKEWLSRCDYAFQAIMYLILLEMYANHQLDSNYKEKEYAENMNNLILQDGDRYKPIIANTEIASKLLHLRDNNTRGQFS